mgnify:CR=1 FL=1
MSTFTAAFGYPITNPRVRFYDVDSVQVGSDITTGFTSTPGYTYVLDTSIPVDAALIEWDTTEGALASENISQDLIDINAAINGADHIILANDLIQDPAVSIIIPSPSTNEELCVVSLGTQTIRNTFNANIEIKIIPFIGTYVASDKPILKTISGRMIDSSNPIIFTTGADGTFIDTLVRTDKFTEVGDVKYRVIAPGLGIRDPIDITLDTPGYDFGELIL